MQGAGGPLHAVLSGIPGYGLRGCGGLARSWYLIQTNWVQICDIVVNGVFRMLISSQILQYLEYMGPDLLGPDWSSLILPK